MDDLPVPLETVVKPWGKVSAITFRDGERYYMLIDRAGTVSLMPASVVEPAARLSNYGSAAND